MPAAIAWLFLFTWYYFTRPLQNNGQFDRLTLALLIPEISALFAGDGGLPFGLRYLPQRFDLIGTALLVATGAWGLGGLLLRGGELGSREAQPAWLDWVERLVVKFGLGLSAWSLITLGFGLAGWLSRSLFVSVLVGAAGVETLLMLRDRNSRVMSPVPAEEARSNRGFVLCCLALMMPFMVAAALAAMLPPFDFDVKEYHLGGPKEWYVDGRVHFLPHNVYTSFPFLTEMLSLSAMVVRGDWFRGALAGQLLLCGFLPLTAAAVFAAGRRLFGMTAGLLGTVVYVTTPWSYRIAVIAYAEGGLSFYLALSLFGAIVAIRPLGLRDPAWRPILLTGLFAGSAMACKYPGVVQVVIPIGTALLGSCFWRWRAAGVSQRVIPLDKISAGQSDAAGHPLTPDPSPQGEGGWTPRLIRVGLVYALGVLLTVGPWLLKNAVETGNPVYPLLWSVFGGTDWDAEMNVKWKAGHSAQNYDLRNLISDLKGVVASSDWQGLLVFGLAPLSLFGPHRRAARFVWCYVGFLVVTWWLLTHRIDRFWVPLLPAACVLAGAGAVWAEDLPSRLGDSGLLPRSAWRFACGLAVVVATAFGFAFNSSPLAGNPNSLADLDAVARTVETPILTRLHRVMPERAKVLLVGEAAIFDARFPVVYNTVFDRNLFEQWTAPPKSAAEIRRTLAEQGVTHVAVNWLEVLRYRTTYGFTPYVAPDSFDNLRRLGVLGDPATLHVAPAAALSPSLIGEAERAFPGLLRGDGDDREMIAEQLYAVVTD